MELSLLNKAKGQVIEAGITRLENVKLHDMGTIAQKPYEELANSMHTINNFTKGKGKGVDFFDAQVSEHDTKFTDGEGSKNILVRITNFLTGQEKEAKVTHDEKSDVPFLRQVYQAVSEAVTGKTEKPIDIETKNSNARYSKYLQTTGRNYTAQRGDVKITDPHSMVAHSYFELRDNINPISEYAKQNGKAITFEDGRTQFNDCESISPILENKYASKVKVIVKDKSTGNVSEDFVDYFENRETPFMKKISNTVGELVIGKKGSNIDKELGLKAQ